jgi:hypothetical protein
MAVVFSALALCAAPARADDFDEAPSPPAERPPTWSSHRGHSGLYVHLDLGVDGVTSQVRHQDPDLKLSGGGLGFALAVGGSLSRYLALGGELWETVVDQPDVRSGGSTVTSDTGSSLVLAGLGPRLTVYIAPSTANLQASITWPCVTQLRSRLNGWEQTTRAGLGGRLSLGKEWWLGNSGWGIGVEGHVFYSNNRDSGNPAPTFDSSGAGLSFSATWR